MAPKDDAEQLLQNLLKDFRLVTNRAQTISDRVKRMEFLNEPPTAMETDRVTAVALLIAGLVSVYAHGMPLPLILQLQGMLWEHFDHTTDDYFKDMVNRVLLQTPAAGGGRPM